MNKTCQVCGDMEGETELCAGCGQRGCDDCVQWCAPEYDPPHGDYFCDECRQQAEPETERGE